MHCSVVIFILIFRQSPRCKCDLNVCITSYLHCVIAKLTVPLNIKLVWLGTDLLYSYIRLVVLRIILCILFVD